MPIKVATKPRSPFLSPCNPLSLLHSTSLCLFHGLEHVPRSTGIVVRLVAQEAWRRSHKAGVGLAQDKGGSGMEMEEGGRFFLQIWPGIIHSSTTMHIEVHMLGFRPLLERLTKKNLYSSVALFEGPKCCFLVGGPLWESIVDWEPWWSLF